jgi:hypothetical protein
LQAHLAAIVGRNLGLEELGVRVDLRGERNGTSSTAARLAKLLRMRFFSVNE